MPLTSRKNLYRGVNPHLHSQFQRLGDKYSMWGAFLTQHSTDIVETFNSTLPDDYRAVSGESLQVLSEEHHLTEAEFVAILIYRRADPFTHPLLGHPVARIEVLSPPNMSGGRFQAFYLQRRRDALQSGVTMVEIDYMHSAETQALSLPDYPHDANSYPYYALVVDPAKRPRDAGDCFAASVNDRLPTIPIPMLGGGVVDLNLDVTYQHTFEVGRWGHQVDYSQPPERMDTYSPSDQQRILDHMTQIAREHGGQN